MRPSQAAPLLALALLVPTPAEAQSRSPFRGLEHGKVYNRPVVVELEPDAPAGGRLLLNGEPARAGARIEEDGIYLLELQPEKAGEVPSSLLFTVDTKPPRLTFRRPPEAPKGALPQVDVDDANPDPAALRWSLDGQPLDRSKPIPPGKHVLAATTRDLAGNTATATEALIIDGCETGAYRHHVTPTRTLTAALYFLSHGGTAECPQNSRWCYCFWSKPGNPRPALGYYSSDNQTVVNAQLKQMADHGIDVVAVQWHGRPWEGYDYEDHVVPGVQARSDLQMVIVYDAGNRMRSVCGYSCFTAAGELKFDDQRVFDTFVQDFTFFASHPSYFRHGKYLKFKNRPVVYVYITRAVRGAAARIQDAFNRIQTAARNNGFAGLYLVADHLYWGAIDYNLLRWTQPKAATSFAPVAPDQGVSQDTNTRPVRTWANKMATLYWNALPPLSSIGIVDLTPGIFVQYNDTGPCSLLIQTMTFNLKDGTDWAYMVQTAGVNRAYVAEQVTVRPNCSEIYSTNTDYTGIVWVYSFNQHWEGTGLEQLVRGRHPTRTASGWSR